MLLLLGLVGCGLPPDAGSAEQEGVRRADVAGHRFDIPYRYLPPVLREAGDPLGDTFGLTLYPAAAAGDLALVPSDSCGPASFPCSAEIGIFVGPRGAFVNRADPFAGSRIDPIGRFQELSIYRSRFDAPAPRHLWHNFSGSVDDLPLDGQCGGRFERADSPGELTFVPAGDLGLCHMDIRFSPEVDVTISFTNRELPRWQAIAHQIVTLLGSFQRPAARASGS